MQKGRGFLHGTKKNLLFLKKKKQKDFWFFGWAWQGDMDLTSRGAGTAS
jgi:hypothetical protein